MTRQLPRPYSPARQRADVRPPAPGQAYFGYPQPTRSDSSRSEPGRSEPGRPPFPVPQQAPSLFEPATAERARLEQARLEQSRLEQSRLEQVRLEQARLERTPVRPAPGSGSGEEPALRAVPKNRPSSHARRRSTRSRPWPHFVGYPLAVILGVLIGVAIAYLAR